MHISLINPYIRLAIPSIIPSGHNIMRRVIYDYELIYLEHGTFSFMYNDIIYRCREGDIIFICPNIPHSFHLDSGEISQPHIHFDITHRPHSDKIPISFKDFDRMTDTEKGWIHKNYFATHKNSPIMNIQNKEAFLSLFYQIISTDIAPLAKKAKMIQLLAMLIKDNFPDTAEEQAPSNTAQRLKDYIDAGNGFGMQLEDYEQFFFQNKFYLEKIFKKEFGASIIEYRNKKRMEFAPYLLKNHSVSKVGEMLGYQSVYSFSRAYKQHYGSSPRNHMSEL